MNRCAVSSFGYDQIATRKFQYVALVCHDKSFKIIVKMALTAILSVCIVESSLSFLHRVNAVRKFFK